MEQQLETALVETYPELYKYTNKQNIPDHRENTPYITFDGIDCTTNWFTIVNQLSQTLEAINENSTNMTIHAEEVSQQFGELVFRTDAATQEVTQAIETARKLSANTCEECATTTGVNTHKTDSTRRTLCEPCALECKNVDREIEIWRFSIDCYECGTETRVAYPRGIGGDHGGTWDTVGETLSEKPYCDIERLYSSVQQQMVWGNTCRDCNAYQGNYYVYEAALEKVTQANGWYPLEDFDCIDIIQRNIQS